MHGKDVEPGGLYALRPWQKRGKPLRCVRAIRAEGASLVYEGPDGQEWLGNLSRVVGPWQPHEDARLAAREAVEELYQAQESHPGRMVFGCAVAVEHGYRDFRIHVTCELEEAQRLAELISVPQRTDDSGSGAGTPEPPIESS
ncbi:hypothetical protein [Actinoallomurus sp. CA-150999]|uniref:hypothetical protein n=1 Tax=Actinoallomurus sp. CA-150999 TaxID=3239887 RepID=UPI003D93CC22